MEKSLADVIAATASLTAAERELEEHATMMAYATITAPFDGVITKRMLDPGAFVQPAERNSAAKPLLSITQSNRLRIFVNVPMAETQWLKNTLTATLKIESMSQEFKAFVIRFSPQLDRSTRTMLVELSLDDPTTPEDESQPKEGTRIYPGSYVQAKLNLVNYPNTPTIPASALLTDDEGKFVYKVVNNRIEKQTVTTIYEDGEQVGIESGLNGGEVIIETGGGQLAPGQQVKTNS